MCDTNRPNKLIVSGSGNNNKRHTPQGYQKTIPLWRAGLVVIWVEACVHFAVLFWVHHLEKPETTFSLVLWLKYRTLFPPKTKNSQQYAIPTLFFSRLLKVPLSCSSSSSLKPSNSSSLSDWLNRRASSAVMNLDLKHGACWQTNQASY